MEHTTIAKQRTSGSARIAFISMFATLAGVLYILDFALPFAFPSFLEFKLSDIPILIGAFTLGPMASIAIVVCEILIKLVIKGTSTMFVGELSDLVTSCAFAITAATIYKKKRTFCGALIAMGIGTLAEVSVALLMNRFVLVPFYVRVFFRGNWTPLVKMMTPLFPDCTKETFYTFYIWCSVLPFNLLRCAAAIGVTLLVYKRISRLINSANRKICGSQSRDGQKAKRVGIIVTAVALAIATLLLTFALLRYFVFE